MENKDLKMNSGKMKVVFRFAIADQREETDGQRVEYEWTVIAVFSCRGKSSFSRYTYVHIISETGFLLKLKVSKMFMLLNVQFV